LVEPVDGLVCIRAIDVASEISGDHVRQPGDAQRGGRAEIQPFRRLPLLADQAVDRSKGVPQCRSPDFGIVRRISDSANAFRLVLGIEYFEVP
jgi:hypothetical protein